MIEKSLTTAAHRSRRPVAAARYWLPEDVNEIFAKGGAMEALLEMQEQKVVRYLGVTGHYRPEALMKASSLSIRHHLMAMNAADPTTTASPKRCCPWRSKADGHHRHEGARPRQIAFHVDAATPRKQATALVGGIGDRPTPGLLKMREAMYYTLSHPVSTIIIGCDNIAQLEENVQLAREFTPLSQFRMAAISDRARPVSKQSLFFRFTDRSRG